MVLWPACDPAFLEKDVKLQQLIPLDVLKEKKGGLSIRWLMEILFNDINEFSTDVYLRHVHGGAVADKFAGYDLFGVDRSLSLAKRVEVAKKAVAKERAQSTLAAAVKAQPVWRRREEVRRKGSWKGAAATASTVAASAAAAEAIWLGAAG